VRQTYHFDLFQDTDELWLGFKFDLDAPKAHEKLVKLQHLQDGYGEDRKFQAPWELRRGSPVSFHILLSRPGASRATVLRHAESS
jgi:hypothetical protein